MNMKARNHKRIGGKEEKTGTRNRVRNKRLNFKI